MRKLFALFIAVTFSFSAMAHPPKAYMSVEPGFFDGGPKVFVNGFEIKPSFSGYDLTHAMKDNALAVEYAKKHMEYSKWAGISLWGGLGAAVGYLVASRPNTNFGVYWGVFAAGLFTAAGLGKASQSYLFKAINTYNGVDTKKTSQLGFSIAPIENGGVLGMNLDF